jgi:hypothetical protein
MNIKNNFSHSGSIGDVWASIPVLKTYYEKTGNKANLFLKKDVPAFYYEGATHPTKNEAGEMVMLNDAMIKMMAPLLEAQECIAMAKVWEDEEIDWRLEMIRETYVMMPYGSISRWYFYVFPDMACDLSKAWLDVPDSTEDLAKGKVIITRSERYQNNRINYEFLKPYEDDCLFIGTMREYNNFCMQFGLNIEKFHVNDFLHMAQAIKQCRFHVTNQTMANQMSTGLQHPSILEVCGDAPNCIPIGEDRYDFLSQTALEYYFKTLYDKYK